MPDCAHAKRVVSLAAQALQEQLLEREEEVTHLQQQQSGQKSRASSPSGPLSGSSQWLQQAQQELMATQVGVRRRL